MTDSTPQHDPWPEPAGPPTLETPATEIALRAEALRKVFGHGDTRVVALEGIDLALQRGRFTAIMGPSGSGKSTLLHCVAGLDQPSGGRVWIGGTELTGLGEGELTTLRRDRVGFVFQEFNLLPTLTAGENITLPLDLAGRRPDPEMVDGIIDAVRLRDRLDHRPSQLSGGQRQRVACARALVTRPDVVFADEPTGALDSHSSAEVLALLRRGADEFGQTVVMVTHEPTAAAHADRVVFLSDGRMVDEMAEPTAERVLDRIKALEGARA